MKETENASGGGVFFFCTAAEMTDGDSEGQAVEGFIEVGLGWDASGLAGTLVYCTPGV